MDKEEYKVRLETIKTLANDGDFKAAASVADTVDWKRVKSVRTLCMIGEIYEASGKYEDTNRVLEYAYWRAQTSKTVLYRLAEVNIKSGHFNEAKRYCDEFEIMSQKDSTRYILRYKLMHAMNEPIEEQIKVLEEYREHEFTERWAYELARLYKANGQDAECVKLCDDMILWFAEGKYVTKAMELKMQLAPLTGEQQKKYDDRIVVDDEESFDGGYGFHSTPEEREAIVRSLDNERENADMQSRIASGLRQVFAGIRSEDKREDEDDFENEIAEEIDTASNTDAKNVKSLDEDGEETKEETVTAEESSEEDANQLTIDDVAKKPGNETLDLDELFNETQMNLADAVASGEYEKTVADDSAEDGLKISEENREMFGVSDEDVPVGQMSFGDLIAAAEAEEKEEAKEAVKEEVKEENKEEVSEMDPREKLYGKETDETLGLTRQFNLQEELAKVLEQQESLQISESDEALRKRALHKTLVSAGIELPEDGAEETAEEKAETSEDAVKEEVKENASDAELLTDDEIIQNIIDEPEVFEKIPVEPRNFDDTEKELFSYFAKVPGMREQITMALADVHNHTGDKTSREGNVMIIGRQGSGKTQLTDAMTLAICHDLGIKAARSAKIIAEDFNEKNPAEVISRLMGGFLVIEGAGDLSDASVEKLLKAMEFRTDDLVVFLEDEKGDLKELLIRHPEIEEKFTSTIVIPVFTNDELVSFAKTYAKERGYRVDEMGILALYTMIGDNQSATEPVTVSKVKDMVDAAIEKADSSAGKLRRRLSKRAVDKDGRILLREKDFDFE